LLGYLIAEGACTQFNIEFTITDNMIQKDYVENVRQAFGGDVVVSERLQSMDGRKDVYRCHLPACVSRWLVYNFNIDDTSCNKRVPSKILTSPEECHITFLQSAFLGDGCIRYRLDTTPSFIYGTCSEELAMDIQAMLLNLGILTYIVPQINKRFPKNTQYRVTCEGNDVYQIAEMFPKFAQHRGFTCPNNLPIHKNQLEYFGSLSGFIREIRRYTKHTRNLIDRRYCIDTENSRTPRRKTLLKWHKALSEDIEWTNSRKKDEILAKLSKILYYRPVRLSSKKPIGIKHGIDLSCNSDMFSYVANGVISHNSQDISELIGGIDYAKIQEYGDETHPDAYNFDGELFVANRGIMEFIEGLRSDEKFLRACLTATQEKSVKAPRFGLIYVDDLILMHCNETEFNEFMQEKKYEAYHDRMYIVRVPYNLSVDNEVAIYEKLLKGTDAVINMHIAPKSLEAASIFSILTRLEEPAGKDLTLIKKMQLYNGQHVKGFKLEQVSDLKKKSPREGMYGVSPRFIIDQISAAISKAKSEERDFITPLDILRTLNSGVQNRDSYTSEQKTEWLKHIDTARAEWNDLLRNDIQKAFFLSFEAEATNLCENYLDMIEASCAGEKPRDPITGDEVELDEKLMSAVEDQIEISDSGKEDFRNEILRAVGQAARKKIKFDYTKHAQLMEGIQKAMFEERKGAIRMTVSTRNPDPEAVKRLNAVIDRMVEQQGYSAAAANELLKYASSHLFDK